MTTQYDCTIGLTKETTYGTVVTPTKFFEFTDEDFGWRPSFVDGSSIRYGQRIQASDRRVLVKDACGGSFTVESMTKGLGALFEAALGVGTSTLITGTSYQQVFTPTTAAMPSYTIQKGIPPLGGGAVVAQTYSGCVCTGFEFSVDNGGVPTFKFNWEGKNLDTSTGYAAASYPASNSLLTFVNGTITVGGTVTTPTATALATGGTAVANVRSATFSWDNNLDKEGYNFGTAGKRGRAPVIGLRSGQGSLVVDYTDNTMRDAYLNQTNLSIVLTFQGTTAISGTNYPTIQLVIPCARLNGEMPKAAGGDVITQSCDFNVYDNRVAAEPVYVVIVTPETAI
jgi:hypothetical protein